MVTIAGVAGEIKLVTGISASLSRAVTRSVANQSEFRTIAAQDETDFDDQGTNGDFTGGADYVVNDEITLSDGTVVVVDAVTTGAVTEFTIQSGTVPYQGGESANGTLTQASTDGDGTGFTLTLGDANETDTAIDEVRALGATLTVAIGGTTVLTQFVKGDFQMAFDPPLASAPGEAVVATLVAIPNVTGVSGAVNLMGFTRV